MTDASVLAGVVVVLGLLARVALWVVERNRDSLPVRKVNKTLKMDSARRDLSGTYWKPQVIAAMVAYWTAGTWLSALALAGIALFAGMSWAGAQRRLRAIRHTPFSKIASAAQGQVELSGRGSPLGSRPLASPLRHTACLWFRYQIAEKNGNRWKIVDSGTSTASFRLDDGSGTCVVQPALAQVDTTKRFDWLEGNRRYTEEWLAPGTSLYVLGHLVSENAAAAGRDARRETRELLEQWKENPGTLRQRFDADGDGEVSLAEWQVAQQQASAKVHAEHARINASPTTTFVRASPVRADFVISDKPETGVVSQVRRSALLRMAWFGVALGGSANAVVRTVIKSAQGQAHRRP